MKTFEEKYTAWIDQRLSEPERVAFEKELANLPEAQHDREEALRLGALLRAHANAPALTNSGFFNHQIVHRIQFAESAGQVTRRIFWWQWSIPKLITAGAIALIAAFVLYQSIVPPTTTAPVANAPQPAAPYFAEVVDAWTADPSISVTTVYTPEDNITVLWLDGLDYLPASYALE
jgi:hypothetical protein